MLALIQPIKMEPRGGTGGFAKDMVVRESLRLESITLKSGSYVYSLAFTYVDNHGNRRTEGPWGGSEGTTQTVSLLLDISIYVLDILSNPLVQFIWLARSLERNTKI
jgi:hypothetical protein